ncbi:hypothetical protein DKX38_025736 [Salix brachista]|uniref:Uncharacterized protein n=1 Tax=Salix brachista TaxID=2182728 RepID=A0A5N5K2K4_9ROSI|nr:hypothetical protein DKX38_025736 [Salix brachista]
MEDETVGIKGSNEAELLAIIKALDLSSTRDEFFGRKFTVEPDYAFVVYWMNNHSIRPWRFHEVFILKRVNYFYRYTNGWSHDKLVTLLDFVLTALSWAALSVYHHTQFVNSGETNYVGFSRNKCQDTLLEQPLLNGDSSSINGKYRGGDSVTPYANAGFSVFLPSLGWLESDSGASSRVTAFKLVKALFLSAWKDILLTALLAIIFTPASYIKNEGYHRDLKESEDSQLQGWEMKFLSAILELRQVETGWLMKYVYKPAMISYVFWGAPGLVAVATFVQTKVSLDRIASFISLDDLKNDVLEKLPVGKF